tara:strand:+ start:315 stop:509 length:195 start_codon:yes stop_codon:yes gene_type:complete
MGLRAGNKSSSNVIQPKQNNQLTSDEIEVLMKMVRDSSFQGKDVESLYNLVIKLQNQYKSLQNQ